MESRTLTSIRSRLALSLGRGLGALFLAMGVTVAGLSLTVLKPLYSTLYHTGESLRSAQDLARRVQSGVESSTGIVEGVSASLCATSGALDETVRILLQAGSALERIREILPVLAEDMGGMSRTVRNSLPGNRLGESAERLMAIGKLIFLNPIRGV